jgi:hypothetical protein
VTKENTMMESLPTLNGQSSETLVRTTRRPLRGRSLGLALLLLCLMAAPGFAQVPQDVTYTGRLVDDLGDPLAGPVDLELRILDAAAAGNQLYSEEHNGVDLDETGAFSVQLGLGTNPVGTFDAELFSEVNRYLEVVVDSEVLTPRQVIGSVPWALVAERANEIVPDPNQPRFEDCGNGTVADHQTGLQWEKKTGTVGSQIDCETAGCPDPHVVNNEYQWSNTAPDPDGGAFTDFLARLNGEFDPDAATGCFADLCDWQLPKISELQTILIGADAAPGQATTCPSAPCIDPDFAAVGGPTGSDGYWSASTNYPFPLDAWRADFRLGTVGSIIKSTDQYVRAVRAGSCN